MTAQNTTTHRRAAARRTGSAEFRVYYGIIFLTALPVACLRWVAGRTVGRGEQLRSPLWLARTMTDEFVTYIFMV